MSAGIFYFTGTGNSLKVARSFREKLEGELIPLVNMGGNQRPEGVVGFVVPVYHLDIPQVVKDAINRMDLSGVDYLFAVVTMGDSAGNALYSLSSLCKNKGKDLDYGMEMKLGDNSIAIVTKPELVGKRFDLMESLVDQMVQAVKSRESNTYALHDKLIWRLYGGFTRFYLDQICQSGFKVASEEQCTRCGLCMRICPVKNIRITDNNVEWGDQRADCFACINWCSQKAISFGKLKLREKDQYRAPGIIANEIIVQGTTY